MKRLLSILTVLAVLISCSKNDPDPVRSDNQNPPQGDCIRSGHQINRYYKIDKLSINEDVLKKDDNGDYVMTVKFTTKTFYGYRTPQSEVSKFEQCAKKFGDTASRMKFPEPIDYGFAISAFVSNVSISSSEAFDASHPAGASLSDIAKIEYLTVYPSIKRHYDPTNLEGLIAPNVDFGDPLYGVQLINKPLDKVSADELAMVYMDPNFVLKNSLDLRNMDVLYRVKLTKTPSYPVQNITIAVTTDEGVYTAKKKVAFM